MLKVKLIYELQVLFNFVFNKKVQLSFGNLKFSNEINTLKVSVKCNVR